MELASENGREHIVKFLLNKGAAVDAQSGDRISALQIASKNGDVNIAKMLLDRGADISARGGVFGFCALQLAS